MDGRKIDNSRYKNDYTNLTRKQLQTIFDNYYNYYTEIICVCVYYNLHSKSY